MNATRVPKVMAPPVRRHPPAQTIAAIVTEPINSATAENADSKKTPDIWAVRCSLSSTANSSARRRSLPNSCTMRIPETVSWSEALSFATAERIARYALLTRTLNHHETTSIGGITAKVTSANRASIAIRMTTMPASLAKSARISTTPEVNASLMASTSVVTRVINRPTGVLSKNAEGSR